MSKPRPRWQNKGRYARLMATAYNNPKLMVAIRDAPGSGALWMMGLSFSADQQTDGLIPGYQVARLLPLPEAEVLGYRDVLLRRRLWDTLGDGDYLIHDWLEYNPSAEEMLARSEEARLAINHRWDTERNTTQTQTQTQT